MTAIASITEAAPDSASTLDQALHLEIHFKVMRLLQAKPDMSQRQMAKALGLSLGKTNYCVQALLKKGWLKLQNFSGAFLVPWPWTTEGAVILIYFSKLISRCPTGPMLFANCLAR
ncbi:MAG TPA: winged helix-turn-helix transcriptional regulator [Rhodoferax sp.]